MAIEIPTSEEALDEPFIKDPEAAARRQKKNERAAFLQKEIMENLQFKLETVPFDARFPYTNQTQNCWQNYVDYHKCRRAKGEDYPPCQQLQYIYKVLCPGLWVERWDEQIEAGRFPSDINPPKMD